MKNIFINLQKAGTVIAFFLLFISGLTAQSNIQQSLSVNSSGAAAHASAQLDVSATDKGMLVPRMTTAQRTAIATPATGLLVFDTDTGGFWFYNGAVWADLSAPKTLADADNDTKVQVEEGPDEDIIRFDLAGTENMVLRKNAGGHARLELPNALVNTFVGTDAGLNNTTGPANTAMGSFALRANQTGESNTAVGRSSMLNNTTGNFNVAVGDRALFANTTGITNVALGNTTMLSNTTGSHNTAVGTGALGNNTTGYSNTAIGRRALLSNTVNSNLVAVGDSSLYNNVAGAANVALGSKALFANTSGSNNTASGFQALFSNTTGNFNTAIGSQALVFNTTGTDNTGIGKSALTNNTTGIENMAIGAAALYNNTIGSNNTASGFQALFSNTTGNFNTAIGSQALVFNTTGTDNTGIGKSALTNNTTGIENMAIGAAALYNNTMGAFSTASGFQALFSNTTGNYNTATGRLSLAYNTTGSNNTAIGNTALLTNTTGSNNTAVGRWADVTTDNLTNATAIGYNAKVGASNSLVLGGTGADAVKVGVGTSTPNASALLDLTSTDKGMLVPRMTTAQRTAIASPATGLLVYDNDTNAFWFYNGTAWTTIGGGGVSTLIADADNDTKVQVEESPDEDIIRFDLAGTENMVLRKNAGGSPRLELHNPLSNTFVGMNAGNANTTGNANTAYGFNALSSNTTGGANTASGTQALYSNTTGLGNTAVGQWALFSNTTGGANTGLGYNTNVSSGSLQNATAIGNAATVNASHKVRIGNTGVTVVEGQVDWTFPSDARFKFNVQDDKVPGLAFIEKLRPVTYQFDTRKFDQHLMQNMPDSLQRRRMEGQDYSKSTAQVQTGFLAQEVEQICKDLGYEFSGLHVPESEVDNYGLAYGSFVPLLVKAVQEQQKEIEKLEIGNLEIEKLKAENAALKAQLDVEKSANALQSAQLAKITAALAGAGIAVEK